MKHLGMFRRLKKLKLQKTRQKERGRSMIEMLGVLAIIGVLSIGGIAGYTMAMNRYKANQLLDAVTKLSIMAEAGAAAHSDSWKGLTRDMFSDVGAVQYSGNEGGMYEATFIIEDGVDNSSSSNVGDVYIAIGNEEGQDLYRALTSIVGNSNKIRGCGPKECW